ncbi:MAG: methionyl-tRNA formyltransferase [Coriobacteriia bacterium]|nr:methionyl-tRNA formyltransferase [Coriobacteriia bacterium]
MRLVFMGTPDFASVILSYLAEQHEVIGVYTRPDAVSKRGNKTLPSPVKQEALKHGLRVFERTSFKDPASVDQLRELAPEAIVVAAYGCILPREVLDIPPYGCLNVHASDLPRWRGAAPIERAILAGDDAVGVCVMRMEEGLDTGDFCVSRTMDIADLGADDLTMRLADLGASAILCALSHEEAGVSTWVKQNESLVTYAHKIEKGELDPAPSDTVLVLSRKVQASGASHPSRCIVAGKGVTLLKGRFVEEEDAALVEGLVPGGVRFQAKRLFLGAADGAYELLSVKPDGKKEMDAKSFAAGIQGIKQGTHTWEEC